MNLDLSWFDLYLIFTGVFWWVSLPLGFAAIAIAAFWRGLPLGVYPLWIMVGVLFLGGPAIYACWSLKTLVEPSIKSYVDRWNFARHTWRLEQPTMVAGLNLPQGTIVQLSMDADLLKKRTRLTMEEIDEIILPRPMNVFGVEIGRKIEVDAGAFLIGTLHRDEIVQGRPCAKGVIRFWYNGSFGGCLSSIDGQLIDSRIGPPQ